MKILNNLLLMLVDDKLDYLMLLYYLYLMSVY
jgi:hypothetical protein